MGKLTRFDSLELDERQRALVHEASHKAFRVVMIAVLIALMTFNFQDDQRISITLSAIAFIGIFAHWFYLRRAGADKEIELLEIRAVAQRPIFGATFVRMTVVFLMLGLGTSYQSGTLGADDIVFEVIAALMGGTLLSLIERSHARFDLRKEENDGRTPSFERGERAGRWLGRMFVRKRTSPRPRD